MVIKLKIFKFIIDLSSNRRVYRVFLFLLYINIKYKENMLFCSLTNVF